jgi:hypothetical protein
MRLTRALVIATVAAPMMVAAAPAKERQVPKTDPVLSAEVILAPASGAALEGAAITAANVKDFAPAPEAVAAARGFFAEKGFDTGRPGGISFTISAPRSVFESVFGKVGAKAKPGGEPVELALGRLPAAVRKSIKAVSFSRPLDFGPTGSFR